LATHVSIDNAPIEDGPRGGDGPRRGSRFRQPPNCGTSGNLNLNEVEDADRGRGRGRGVIVVVGVGVGMWLIDNFSDVINITTLLLLLILNFTSIFVIFSQYFIFILLVNINHKYIRTH
jgi:hypothetical protein